MDNANLLLPEHVRIAAAQRGIKLSDVAEGGSAYLPEVDIVIGQDLLTVFLRAGGHKV